MEWSPDSRALFYTGIVDGPRSVYRIAADGTGKPELVFRRTEWWINDASARPDGSGTLIAAQDTRGHDLYFVPTGTQRLEPFLVTPAEERGVQFSPNGAFVLYVTNESDRNEVYVRAFSAPASKRQISTNGGVLPSWSPDGREIFYWEIGGTTGRLMQVAFEPGNEPKIGAPHVLFEVPQAMVDRVSLMPDGRRFVMVQPEPEVVNPSEMVVIPRFLDEIAARLNLKPSH
jgi:Tol biopolymer transport system component